MKTLGLKLDPVTERYGRIVSIPAAKRVEDYQASISDPNVKVDYRVYDIPFYIVSAVIFGTIAFHAFANSDKIANATSLLGENILAAGKFVLAIRWQAIFGL